LLTAVVAGACTPPPNTEGVSFGPSVQGPSVQPSQRLPGASLFGTDVIGLPTGASLTPDAAPGSVLLDLDPQVPEVPAFRAGGAVSTALSPDGRTLIVLTSGFNRIYDGEGRVVPAASSEWVFVYDVTGAPRRVQAVSVPNAFDGIAFGPRGDRFYVGGGSDDVVREYARGSGGGFAEVTPAIQLGHVDARGLGGLGIDEGPYAAGVAVTPSGARLVVANTENDSVSLVDLAARRVLSEVQLSPGSGQAGGEFPFWVTLVGEGLAYVSCQRDREVAVVDLLAGRVVKRIPVGGEPGKMTLNHTQSRLFVANANSDSISVIALPAGTVVSELRTPAPAGSPAGLLGSNPNDVALSPDERILYVTNGGNNSLAVFALSDRDRGAEGATPGSGPSVLTGLVPTGFYPNAVTVGAGGRFLYVAHGKSPSGPNRSGPWADVPRSTLSPYSQNAGNQYSLQLMHGGLLAFPRPDDAALAKLTRQVLQNNRFAAPTTEPDVFRELRGKVKHVVYVIGENRTYDQILGDLPGADGDPALVHWGEPITPNHHTLARDFVTLDRFFASGGVSGDGWQWSTSGRTTDVAEKAIPVEYADRGVRSYDWEGKNRNVNMALPTPAARAWANPRTPTSSDLLPGPADVAGVDEPALGGRGYLWDAALAAGLGVRNYGFFVDDSRYGFLFGDARGIPPLARPFEDGVQVAFATRPSLLPVTDPFFRGFDMNLADYWRLLEWEREFDRYAAAGDLPALELVRLPHDHLGGFRSALDGVSTPDTQIADHDYALGRLVERISRSPFWEETVIFALEDDAQNGSDHVDSHRSFLLVAGGHVKRHVKVSTVYTTPSVLRTIELLLGTSPLGQGDGFAEPMADLFSVEADDTPYVAKVPGVLRSTRLPLPAPQRGEVAALPRGTPEGWSLLTEGFDFSRADAAPAARMNRVLFCELVSGAGCVSEGAPPLCLAEPPDRD
jgi:DNA-binding beta-propeller fold protein YncE